MDAFVKEEVVIGEDMQVEVVFLSGVRKENNMEQMQASVLEFHQAFGLEIGKEPHVLSTSAQKRRDKLIREELKELNYAFYKNNLEDAVDGIADLLYVVLGVAIEMGVDMEDIFKEVHKSNMTKVDGHKREDGKWIKPDNYTPPNIKIVPLPHE